MSQSSPPVEPKISRASGLFVLVCVCVHLMIHVPFIQGIPTAASNLTVAPG